VTESRFPSEETVEATAVELEPVTDYPLFETRGPIERLQVSKRVADALKAEMKAAGMVKRIGSGEHVLVEGWQTLGVMAGVTTRIAWSRQIEDGWEARAEVVAADGRVVGAGESMCLRSERGWSRKDAYALRSMAQTRAVSRALRAVLAFVMVLSGYSATPAEEASTDSVNASVESTELPEWAKPASINDTAKALTAILEALEIEEAASRMRAIGECIRARCGGEVPICVLAVLQDLQIAASSSAES
jgi:hypothetical protein